MKLSFVTLHLSQHSPRCDSCLLISSPTSPYMLSSKSIAKFLVVFLGSGFVKRFAILSLLGIYTSTNSLVSIFFLTK